jgi:hypothetical protein
MANLAKPDGMILSQRPQRVRQLALDAIDEYLSVLHGVTVPA